MNSESTQSTPFYQRTTREIPDIEQPAIEFAKRRGWLVYKFVSPSTRGVPDRIFMRDGHVVFCEFKAPGKRPTRQQRIRHREIEAHGGEVVWFDDLEAACDFFR